MPRSECTLQYLNLDRIKGAAGAFFCLLALRRKIGNNRRANDVFEWRYWKNYRTINKEPAQ